MLSEQQRNQLSTGKTLTGEPLMKVEIEGTASQSVALERGTYMIAVLNREPVPVQIAFRATFRGY